MSKDQPVTSLLADALSHLDSAAQYAGVDAEVIERLKHPNSALQVSVPVRMDDGSAKIFTGP